MSETTETIVIVYFALTFVIMVFFAIAKILKKENKMITFSVKFNEKQNKALGKTAKEMGKTKTEVIKTALSLLTVVIREQRTGNSIGIIKDGKVLKEIIGITK